MRRRVTVGVPTALAYVVALCVAPAAGRSVSAERGIALPVIGTFAVTVA
jgi:hypothetical protein